MRVSLNWLRDYVDPVLPPEDLAHRLTLAGFEIKAIEVVGGAWDRVQVGQIREVKPHPNADRLRLVTVSLGERSQTVVCGAPNLNVGDKIAFASVGARLIDGHSGEVAALKPAKIRGVVSEGMVCSEKELGISDSHEGIMVLPGDAPVGTPLRDYLGDTIFDIEVSPNRPDGLSVLGIGREVAALTGQGVRMPGVAYAESETPVASLASVEIVDPELCPRYCASVIEGVRIAPSPEWMQRRLKAAGMRPINNVVDVTNYVMLEYGQPLHAFDYRRLAERKIIVRRARDGEVIVSLDGVERGLNHDMLLICDGREAVAVAGVMGGLDSEVSDVTVSVLLESANFNQAFIRRTSATLGLRSEASLRFEKGLPAELPVPALRRATQLIAETSGGKAASGIIDVYPGRRERQPISLFNGEVGRLLGMDVPVERTRQILESLGFDCEMSAPSEMRVSVPYWRSDVGQSADLVEEVARIIGYDQVPTTVIAAPIPSYEPSPVLLLKERLRDILVACGLQEVITYSLTSLENLKRTMPDLSLPGPMPLRMANPMSREQEYLRTSLRPRLLLTLAQNQRYEDSVKLFEVGRVYLPRSGDLPQEAEALCAVFGGASQERSWRAKEAPVDLFDAKGVAEAVLERLGVDASFVPGEDAGLRRGRCADIVAGGERVGVLGEVHPRVVENFEATGPVYLLEMELDRLLPCVSTGVRYRPLSRFPATVRDIAVVVEAGVRFQSVLDLVRGFPLVSQVTLFDVYQGDQVPQGKKSLAFRVVYQSPTHTLTDEEVNGVQQRMIEALKDKLGAVLRG
ncbi:MAG: phenylalanine--tRNA ligase subunit beta [Chloroflexota bacterium]